MLVLWGIAGASWCFLCASDGCTSEKLWILFLTVLRKSMQKYINIDPTGLSLCSLRSAVDERFVALTARFHLVSLVNKHRPVCAPYRLKSIPLQERQLSKGGCEKSPGKARCRMPSSFRGVVKPKSPNFEEGPVFANDDQH